MKHIFPYMLNDFDLIQRPSVMVFDCRLQRELVEHTTWNCGHQVRQVMDIMSLLAYACPSQASVLRDDIHIVLRKQMSFGGTSKGRILQVN